MTEDKPTTDKNEGASFLTLFEQERGFAFTRSGRFYNAGDVAPLASQAQAIAKAEGIDLADAAERVAPNVWDEAANHFECTYDLRRAIVNHVRHELTKAKKAAKAPTRVNMPAAFNVSEDA